MKIPVILWWSRNRSSGRSHVCMTFEFDDREKAELAEEALRRQGEHTEGVGDSKSLVKRSNCNVKQTAFWRN